MASRNKVCVNKKAICENRKLTCYAVIGGITIVYFWDSSGGHDLETWTTCGGDSVGYSKNNAPHGILKIDRDDTSSSGRETVTVFLQKTGTNIVTIDLRATWFGEPTSGKFQVVVRWDSEEGVTELKKTFSTTNRYADYFSCGTVTIDRATYRIEW